MDKRLDRNLSLDILKILACFSVVILHVFGRKTNMGNIIFYYLATFAIPIFFMVNGFLQMNKENITYNYVIKKIVKIIIIIVTWNVLISLKNIIISKEFINPIIGTMKSLLQQGTFYQFWFFGSLIIIYSILPKLHQFVSNNKKAYQTILLMLFFVCLIVDIINIILGIKGEEIFTSKIIQTFRLWTWMFYFLLGGYIGRYNLKIKHKLNLDSKMIGIIIILFTVLYQYCIGKYVFKNFHAEYFYDNVLVIIYVILVWGSLYKNTGYEKYAVIIGNINRYIMGIYILHPFIIRLISKFYNYENPIVNIIVCLLTVAICTVISMLISKLPKFKKIITI